MDSALCPTSPQGAGRVSAMLQIEIDEKPGIPPPAAYRTDRLRAGTARLPEQRPSAPVRSREIDESALAPEQPVGQE